ncbi:uncharacterized protein [Macrobrachium rosenbergii]|uniref:uncharacterized protein n=1 Tax=Macrobrachium rosenbergii TaxID=79674 RepID=UPI0034D65FB4
MAAFRLALTHTYDTTPTSSMWYAHNYAQRRTHARNFTRNHCSHDYSHNVNHEYAHAAPSAVYAHNPYHICQDRTIEPGVHAHTSHNTHGEYNRPYQDYLVDYGHSAVLTHPHTLGQSRTHTPPASSQRSSHSASSHSLASQGRCGHNETQSNSHLSDIDVNQFGATHNSTGHAYTHECQYSRDTQSSRTRQHAQEQGSHACAREQGGTSRNRHHSHQNRRHRTRNHDVYPFYPEFIQSSEEEESALEDDVRVDLPYTHLHCRGRSTSGREDYSHGRTEHIIRRFEDPPDPCVPEDVSTVGLSYQQRADVCTTQGHPTPGGISVSDGDGLSDGRTGLLIGEGLVREWVRAVGVVAASGTLVTLVLLGFGVYNMLITTLFLLFVLTTVALLIFLLMRRPPCCPCCQDPYDTTASTNGDSSSQTAHIPYLTENHGIVVKKWMKDSPPPYESPPDYSSLSPELIMDAKTLQELVTTSQSQNPPVGVHTTAITTSSSSPACQGRSSSPLCTTPLFSTSFCDTPRSLTPTMMSETKVRAVYESPPSPIFSTHHFPTSTSSYVSSSLSTSAASATVPSAVYGQPGAPPPAYETLRLYSQEAGRRKDNH